MHLKNAVVAQLAERGLPKPEVAGSTPVYRSIQRGRAKNCAPSVCICYVAIGMVLWLTSRFGIFNIRVSAYAEVAFDCIAVGVGIKQISFDMIFVFVFAEI